MGIGCPNSVCHPLSDETRDPNEIFKAQLESAFQKNPKQIQVSFGSLAGILPKIKKVQVDTFDQIMRQGMPHEESEADAEMSFDTLPEGQKETAKAMAELNALNSQYAVEHGNGGLRSLTDWESIMISVQIEKYAKGTSGRKEVWVPSVQSQVNVVDFSVVDSSGKKSVLKKAFSRHAAIRPADSQRLTGMDLMPFHLQRKSQSFSTELGAYGNLWGLRVKGDEGAKPSPDEMFAGLEKWLLELQFEKNLKKIPPKWHKQQRSLNCEALAAVIKSMQLSDSSSPMNLGMKDENDLWNPYGKVACLVLYLHTMEIGEPPLYAEINKVCRNMDESYLDSLGPYISALGWVTLGAEEERESKERIATGEQLGGLKYNMSGVFLVFRGGQIEQESISQWEQAQHLRDGTGLPLTINMPGYTSCSESLSVALKFAFRKQEQTMPLEPVLFVISCQNYLNFNGIRLGSQANSAYPNEREVLLMEGCDVHVLTVDRNFRIWNTHESFSAYNKNKMTIIHLFHRK